jgi:uncharacterized protein (TIGR03067 family)
VVTAATLASLASASHTLAAVPAGLTDATARAAILFAGGPTTATGAASVEVIDMAKEFLKTLFLKKLQMALVAFLSLGLVTGGLFFLFSGLAAKPKGALPEGGGPKAQDSPSDLVSLQGTWRVTAAVLGGQPFPGGEIKMVFSGNQCQLVQGNGPPFAMTFALDPTQDPKTINLINAAGQIALGIYWISGNELKISYNDVGTQRPTALVSTPGSNTLSYELQRDISEPRP